MNSKSSSASLLSKITPYLEKHEGIAATKGLKVTGLMSKQNRRVKAIVYDYKTKTLFLELVFNKDQVYIYNNVDLNEFNELLNNPSANYENIKHHEYYILDNYQIKPVKGTHQRKKKPKDSAADDDEQINLFS